jgi:hypothetical protein
LGGIDGWHSDFTLLRLCSSLEVILQLNMWRPISHLQLVSHHSIIVWYVLGLLKVDSLGMMKNCLVLEKAIQPRLSSRIPDHFTIVYHHDSFL